MSLLNHHGRLNQTAEQGARRLETRRTGALRSAALLVLLGFLCGCVSIPQPRVVNGRKFDFQKDTFAYSNDLVWEYYFDAHGKWVYRRRHPQPDYTHHCFVVARSTRQFFLNARFDPGQPVADEPAYRRLIRKVA